MINAGNLVISKRFITLSLYVLYSFSLTALNLAKSWYKLTCKSKHVIVAQNVDFWAFFSPNIFTADTTVPGESEKKNPKNFIIFLTIPPHTPAGIRKTAHWLLGQKEPNLLWLKVAKPRTWILSSKSSDPCPLDRFYSSSNSNSVYPPNWSKVNSNGLRTCHVIVLTDNKQTDRYDFGTYMLRI